MTKYFRGHPFSMLRWPLPSVFLFCAFFFEINHCSLFQSSGEMKEARLRHALNLLLLSSQRSLVIHKLQIPVLVIPRFAIQPLPARQGPAWLESKWVEEPDYSQPSPSAFLRPANAFRPHMPDTVTNLLISSFSLFEPSDARWLSLLAQCSSARGLVI